MNRKVSFNIGYFCKKLGEKGALRFARDVGADAVDFDLLPYDESIPGNLYTRSDEEIRAHFEDLAAYAKQIGIEIGQTHGRIKGFKNIPEEDASLVRSARLDCLATRALGAKYCVMHTTTSIYMGENPPSDLMHKMNLDMFSQILPFAKQYDVIIATETFGDARGGTCIDFFGDITQFIKGYNAVLEANPEYSEYFKVCMDTGHSHKSTRFPGNPPVGDVIRMLGSRIQAVHLNDNNTFSDQHKIPLTATIDWNDAFAALREIGYSGIYSMEIAFGQDHYGPDFAHEEAAFAVKVMRNILNSQSAE
ncbi:MAG: TIM barrel protein [Eubacteriales bacterium]|nr:TIM barrel protein [Eubacteriales bacterium]